MKTKLLVLIFFVVALNSFGQNPWALKEYSNWFFGERNLLTFKSDGTISSITFPTNPSSYAAYEGCTSISDSLGNLLFASNGRSVFDKNGNYMEGGNNTLLSGNEGGASTWMSSSVQGAVTIKHPKNDSLYLVFTLDDAISTNTNGFNCTVINIRKNNGLGKVEKIIRLKNNLSHFFRTTEQCSATLHANGSDIWIVIHESGTRNFLSYLIKEHGVDTINPPVISNVADSIPQKTSQERGYLNFSWDGKLLASNSWGFYQNSWSTSNQVIYGFNNSNGEIYRIIDIKKGFSNLMAGSILFSPKNQKLYVESIDGISQFDISDLTDSVKIYNSKKLLSSYSSVKMGLDGNLYFFSKSSTSIHKSEGDIESSNLKIVTLKTSLATKFLEELPIMFAPKANPTKSANFSYTKNKAEIIFKDLSYFDATYLWDFGDGTTSTEQNPKHNYQVDGKYNVCLIASGPGWKDTVCKDVESWFRKISGIVYSDENKNGIKDINEKGIKGAKATLTPDASYYATYTNDTGYYEVFVYDTARINLEVSVPKYNELTQPSSLKYTNVSINQSQNLLSNKHFGLHKNNYFDLESWVTPHIFRPGFNAWCFVTTKNNGSINATNFQQALVFDSRLTPVDLPFGFVQKNDTIFYTINLITPETEHTRIITFYVPQTMPRGEELRFISIAKIEPDDIEPKDNIDTTYRVVTGSYDPNIKISSFGDADLELPINEMEYTIHFQNTGSDTAFTVVVVDSLATNHFDVKTVEMISSSHNYCFAAKANGLISWTFKNILLPDSTTNEKASHGYIRFKVAAKSGLTEGMTLKNRAYIYFDFNEPVITDYSSNHIKIITSNKQSLTPLGNLIYPNPTKNQLSIKGEIKAYQILNSLGQIVSEGTSNIIFLSNLSSGQYWIKIEDSHGKISTFPLVKE